LISVVIDRLAARHPRMRFQVEVAQAKDLLGGLRRRDLDLAATQVANAGAEPDLWSEVLFEDALVAMAGRRNLLVRRRVSFAGLVDEPWPFCPMTASSALSIRRSSIAAVWSIHGPSSSPGRSRCGW
jgi:DNA-binding transcriptional LysR family regulator